MGPLGRGHLESDEPMRVLLLGATGMLGSAIYGELHKEVEFVLGVRHFDNLALLRQKFGGLGDHQSFEFNAAWAHAASYVQQCAGTVDWVINACGVTIPFAGKDTNVTLMVNGIFPHMLAHVYGNRLIHISTDCVYDGKSETSYDEKSPRSPLDIYGMSKSIGEPEECLTLRTSIIGRELHGFTGLLEWFLRQKGQTIQGYTGHSWNGITTKQFAKICRQIMTRPSLQSALGVRHIFSTSVTKYEMLLAFQKKFGIDCTIEPNSGTKQNRRLGTVYDFNIAVENPSFAQMIEEM
jgi:dTDP-4-dehydrorhamnose reductase